MAQIYSFLSTEIQLFGFFHLISIIKARCNRFLLHLCWDFRKKQIGGEKNEKKVDFSI
ncbi:hypothetical protein [Enterococcus gallinarum]|uniref:hypothetical protein n=1 Tax=Enterococcus gallinarum TaxID=1353 RepID=UPI0022E7861C|nr:hypothetical protein [Enterococcus gallinarum]